jgi:acetamidase/formamidase
MATLTGPPYNLRPGDMIQVRAKAINRDAGDGIFSNINSFGARVIGNP